MDYNDIVHERRSIRGYLRKPVPRELIEEIIDLAKRAPSSMNTKPWHFHVITGEPLERIRKGNTEKMMSGSAVDREIKMNHGYEGPHRERQIEIAVQLFEAMGIARDDKKARRDQWGRNYEFFGAPVSLFVFAHSGLGEYAVSDASLFAQNLMLSAHAHGLGTCAQGASALWAKPVRAEFKVPKQYKLLYGIALGYPSDHSVNSFQAERIDIENIKLKPND